jgi:hypothetical protein
MAGSKTNEKAKSLEQTLQGVNKSIELRQADAPPPSSSSSSSSSLSSNVSERRGLRAKTPKKTSSDTKPVDAKKRLIQHLGGS